MSLEFTSVGTASLLFPPSSATPTYGQNASATSSSAGTTRGSEAGAAAVVYAPSAIDATQAVTYRYRDQASRIAHLPPTNLLRAAGALTSARTSGIGDEAIVQLRCAVVLTTSQTRGALRDVSPGSPADSVRPAGRAAMPDVAGAIANGQPSGPMPSDGSAQAVYALVANASLESAPLAGLPKFA